MHDINKPRWSMQGSNPTWAYNEWSLLWQLLTRSREFVGPPIMPSIVEGRDIRFRAINLSTRKETTKPTTISLIRKKTSKEKIKPTTIPNSHFFLNQVVAIYRVRLAWYSSCVFIEYLLGSTSYLSLVGHARVWYQVPSAVNKQTIYLESMKPG